MAGGGRAQRKRVSGAGFCSAGSRFPSLATGRAIIINIICLHHSPSTFAFSCRYEDGMLINERGRHSAIRPVPHPPSAPSLCVPLQPSIPKRDGGPICFPASPQPNPTPLLLPSIVVCTKGDKFNSFLWQGSTDRGVERARKRGRWGGWRKTLPRREHTTSNKKKEDKKLAE